MNSPLANLTSLERRFVVGVAVVVFVVLNLLFVRPRFQDWGKVQQRMAAARRTLEKYRNQINASTNIQIQVDALEKGGLSVPPEDAAVDFLKTITSAAAQTGVNIQTSARATTRTNDQFFLEQGQSITVLAREENLVNFLHTLSAGNSLITVRDCVLRPDQPRQQLSAQLKLVASYQKNQKKSPVKTGPPGAAASAATTVSPTRNR